MSKTTILIFEDIPENTIIANLCDEDFNRASITLDNLKSISGKVENSDRLTSKQQETFEAVYSALHGDGIWFDRIIDHTQPFGVGGPCEIIWCGSAM